MSRQMTPHFHKSKTLDNKYMSPSVAGKPSMGRHSSRRSVSSERDRSPPPRRRERSLVARSRHSRSPPKRERSPTQRKSSYKDKDGSPHKERHSDRVKSPKRESRSLSSRSVSPRSKRLKRVQAETEVDRASERDHGKRDEKPKHERSYKDRDSEKEAPKERRERRSELESKSDRDRTQGREMEKDRDKDAGGYRASSKSKHRRSESPSERHHHRSRRHSRSPPPASRSRAHDEDNESRGTRGAEHRDDENDAVAQMKAAEEALETKEKQKPSFELSGKLAEETNRVRGVTLLFTEPPDARKPDIRWRLYVFKGGEVLNEPLYVHRQSCYLFGRERRVADIPTDHPSCSKQHAVLQYRQVEVERSDGMMAKQTKPYLMDLGSTNKTFINEAPIEPQRYYELFEKDTIKFGNSSREYVLLHENSMT